uniref:GATA zinc finger domain-containing protein 1 n=1 Tax=Phallusia mammillata TaxID=59560 RepID=A0A6F9DCW6_9ASCI|nr:Gat-like GATA zinc finger domain-containing protein [Phallusia mammillata]
MPFGETLLECKHCGKDSSAIWRKDSNGDLICHLCFIEQETAKREAVEEVSTANKTSKQQAVRPVRNASMRIKSTRHKVITKGKSRRNVLKTKFPKVGEGNSANLLSESVFYKGQYFQSGDIVSVVDSDDHQEYFAQCRGFVTNQFCEKMVAYTWLLPTTKHKLGEQFDPRAFYLGPEDDILHDMASVEFVCNAPDDYYRPISSMYPTYSTTQSKKYISVTMTP